MIMARPGFCLCTTEHLTFYQSNNMITHFVKEYIKIPVKPLFFLLI